MKIWNVNMDKLNEDDLNDCETFMLIDYILAMRKKIKELQIEVKQIGHSFIQKGELLNKALDTIKAKEQECEELKNIINEAKNSKLDLNSFFAIEATVGEYQLELDQLKAEKDLFRTCHDNEQAKRIKFEQCLAEIKEIAEHCINQDICTFCDYSDRCHIEDEEIPTYDVCKLILQKISECEGNDE